MSENIFTEKTKKILERRAGSVCSNPYCKVTTAGPSSEESKAINLGQAAHIQGANPGSARHNEKMKPQERSDITNGIWLCSKCAKLIDSDERNYNLNLLYTWKRNHEDETLYKTGTSGWERRILEEKLLPIKNVSLRALQLAIDKPPYWEHLLTAELFRTVTSLSKLQLQDLENGLGYRRTNVFTTEQFKNWIKAKLADLTNIVNLVTVLINTRLEDAWGKPGEPGDEMKIYHAAMKVRIACIAIVEWEEDLRFTEFPEEIQFAQKSMQTWPRQMFGEMERIADELIKGISIPREGEEITVYEINLVFKLPEEVEQIGNSVIRYLKKNL